MSLVVRSAAERGAVVVENDPPVPPPFLPSRLGTMTPATFSSARNGMILLA